MNKIVCYQGNYLQFCQVNHWEFVERRLSTGVVILVTVTAKKELLFVEQFRPAVNNRVLEFPAGLVGDHPQYRNESHQAACERELFEETGYVAKHWEALASGPPASGLSSELVAFYYANPVEQKGIGGGVGSEKIKVHPVPLNEVDSFIQGFQQNTGLVAVQIYAGLHLARHYMHSV